MILMISFEAVAENRSVREQIDALRKEKVCKISKLHSEY